MCKVRQTKPDENLGNIDFQGIFMSQLRKIVGHSKKLIHNITTKPSIFEGRQKHVKGLNTLQLMSWIQKAQKSIYINNTIQYNTNKILVSEHPPMLQSLLC